MISRRFARGVIVCWFARGTLQQCCKMVRYLFIFSKVAAIAGNLQRMWQKHLIGAIKAKKIWTREEKLEPGGEMPVCASLFLLHSLEESAQTHHIVPRNIFGRCKADDVLGPLDSVNSVWGGRTSSSFGFMQAGAELQLQQISSCDTWT